MQTPLLHVENILVLLSLWSEDFLVLRSSQKVVGFLDEDLLVEG
jgi:hypothetical protein